MTRRNPAALGPKEVPMTHVAQIRLIGLGPVSALTRGALIGPPLEQDEMPYSGLA